tara:strand:+ start:602 stop:808 length:207 start_codon:yes stop_codon:yes gene_type:complete
MSDHILDNIRKVVKGGSLNEDAPTMSAGTGGFSSAAAAEGPVAGFDPAMGKPLKRKKLKKVSQLKKNG